jgi:hypothetical protein
MTNRFLERMRSIDPNYGSQPHQAQFIRNYEERQRLAPCSNDHEHEDACYAIKGVRDGSFVSFKL